MRFVARPRARFGTTGTAIPGIAEIKAELGGYLKAAGKDGGEVSQILSYALYRTFRETNLVTRHLTDGIWGAGGTTGQPAYDEAEDWSRAMEELFARNPEAAVEIGLYVGASVGVGDEDVASGSVAGAFRSGRVYNNDSITKRRAKGGGAKTELWAQKSLGDRVRSIALEGGVSLPFGLGIESEVEVVWSPAGTGRESELQEVTASVTAALDSSGWSGRGEVADKVISTLTSLSMKLRQQVERAGDLADAQDAEREAPTESNTQSSLGKAKKVQEIGAQLEMADVDLGASALGDRLEVGKTLNLTLEMVWEQEKGLSVTLELTEAREASLGVGFVSVTGSRTQRLVKLELADGVWAPKKTAVAATPE